MCVCEHSGSPDLLYRLFVHKSEKKVVLKVKNEYDLLLCIQVKMSEVDVHKVSDGCICRQALLIPSPVTITYIGKHEPFEN